MIPYAFDLSEKLGEPVIFRTTTRINHSNAVVTLGALKTPQTTGRFEKDPFSYVTVPAVSRQLHVRLLDNIARAQAKLGKLLQVLSERRIVHLLQNPEEAEELAPSHAQITIQLAADEEVPGPAQLGAVLAGEPSRRRSVPPT